MNTTLDKLNTELWADAIKLCVWLPVLALLIIFDKSLFLQIVVGFFAARNLIDAILTTIVMGRVRKNKVVIVSKDEDDKE